MIAEWSINGDPQVTGGKTKPGSKKNSEVSAKAGANGSDPPLPPEESSGGAHGSGGSSSSSPVVIDGLTSMGMTGDLLGNVTDGMLAVMMNQMAKYAIQDQREDRKFASAMKQLALAAKSEKLKTDNASIRAGMDEAK